MAETAAGRQPPAIARVWQRVTPSLVPILAVVTALLITVPFMILTGGEGSISKGLNIAGTAYSALIEGSLGIVVNREVSRGDFDQFLALARSVDASAPLDRVGLRRLSRSVGDLVTVGMVNAQRYGDLLAKFPDLSSDDIANLADSLPDMAAIGLDRLEAMRPLVTALSALDRSEVSDLAKRLAALSELPPGQRADLLTTLPVIDQYSDADLLADMKLVDQYGIVRLQRLIERLDLLNQAGIDPITADGTLSPDAQELIDMAALNGGVDTARSAADTLQLVTAAGIVNVEALSQQIEDVRALYSAGLLTSDDVMTAVNTELDPALQNNLVVSRPGNRLLVDNRDVSAGAIISDNNTPDNPDDDYTESVYLRLGGSTLLFFPSNSGDDARPLDPVHHRRAGGGAGLQSRAVQHRRGGTALCRWHRRGVGGSSRPFSPVCR